MARIKTPREPQAAASVGVASPRNSVPSTVKMRNPGGISATSVILIFSARLRPSGSVSGGASEMNYRPQH